jgi:hypothetical protein
MKNILLLIILCLTYSIFAHDIKGTLVLRGTIKTKVNLNGIKTTCKIEIKKVKNLMLEDSYGNPAYQFLADISLDGRDSDFNKVINSKRSLWFNNYFVIENDKTEIRDFDYKATSEVSTIVIDESGRIKKLTLLYGSNPVTCLF